MRMLLALAKQGHQTGEIAAKPAYIRRLIRTGARFES